MLYGEHRSVPFIALQRYSAVTSSVILLKLSAKLLHYLSIFRELGLSSVLISAFLVTYVEFLSSKSIAVVSGLVLYTDCGMLVSL